MKRGMVGGIYLLACLFFARGEEINASEDLKDRNSEEESRSGAIADNSAVSDNGKSNADASGGGTALSQSLSSSHDGLKSTKATAVLNGDSSNTHQIAYPFSPRSSYIGRNTGNTKSTVKAQGNSGLRNYPVDWLTPERPSDKSDTKALAKTKSSVKKSGYNYNGGTNQFQPGYLYPRDSNQWNQLESGDLDKIGGQVPGSVYQPTYLNLEQGGHENFLEGMAETEANIQALSRGSNGGHSPYSGSRYSSQVSKGGTAQAQADTQAISEGFPRQNPYVGSKFQLEYPKIGSLWNQGSSSEVQVLPAYESWNPVQGPYIGPIYQTGNLHPGQGGQGQSSAQAEAKADSGSDNPKYNGYQTGLLEPNGASSAEIHSQAQAYGSRYNNTVSCSRLGGLHYLQTSLLECMVCVCVKDNGILLPACVSCSACFVPESEPVPPSLQTIPPRHPPMTVIPISPAPEPQLESQDLATYQREPFLFRDIRTVVPWKMPIPAPQPTPTTVPGSLPRPKPHESCRPFTPDHPFQHPWDGCQMCVCSESIAMGLVTIEVNCYIKKSCCYEPPELIETTYIPYIHGLQIIDPICKIKSFGVEFTHPQDFCKTCFCDLRGSIVKSVCYKSANPERQTPVYPSEDVTYTAEAYAVANSQSSDIGPLNFSPGFNGYRPRSGDTGSSQASAQASSEESLAQQPGQMIHQYKRGKIYPGQNRYKPGHNYGNVKYPGHYYLTGNEGYWGNQGVLDNQGAKGVIQGKWNVNQDYWFKQENEKSSESAKADSVIGSLKEYPPIYPTYYYPEEKVNNKNKKVNTLGDIETLAEKESLDVWMLNNKKYQPNRLEYFYPGGNVVKGKGNYAYSGYEAAAKVLTKSGKFGDSSFGTLDGVPTSFLYANLFKRPSYQITPLYIPEKGYESSILALNPGLEGSGRLVKAHSPALSQSSNTAKSQAQTGARIDKSGNPEVFDDDEKFI